MSMFKALKDQIAKLKTLVATLPETEKPKLQADIDALEVEANKLKETAPAPTPTPTPAATPPAAGDLAVTIQALQETVKSLTESLTAEKTAREQAQKTTEDRIKAENKTKVDTAIAQGKKDRKITPATEAAWRKRFENDFADATEVLKIAQIDPAAKVEKTQPAATTKETDGDKSETFMPLGNTKSKMLDTIKEMAQVSDN